MEMSISSRRGPPSILMLSMLARQGGEHPVRINPPPGSCLMRRADKGAEILTSISEYKYCGGNGVGHGREKNRQSLTKPPYPFISTAPSHFPAAFNMPRLHNTLKPHRN